MAENLALVSDCVHAYQEGMTSWGDMLCKIREIVKSIDKENRNDSATRTNDLATIKLPVPEEKTNNTNSAAAAPLSITETSGSKVVAPCDRDIDALKGRQASKLSTASTDCPAGSCSGSSDTFSLTSVRSIRPGCRGSPVVLSVTSLKGRSLGKDDAEVWSGISERTQLQKLELEQRRCENWPEVEQRWKESLCVEKKDEDRLQRPANGTFEQGKKTKGPFACFLPQKELDVLRASSQDVRYTNKQEIDSQWIATVCAEKKINDAQDAQRTVEEMSISEAMSQFVMDRMAALDERIREHPIESSWTNKYYYSSQIVLQ